MINKGLVDRWIEQEIPNSTACVAPPGSAVAGMKRPLSLKDYYGIASVFAASKSIKVIKYTYLFRHAVKTFPLKLNYHCFDFHNKHC